MTAPSASLLTFLDAPVVVGDPDGRAAYLNPSFEAGFGVAQAEVRGMPLAQLFEGGAREAVLRAVARVCERGRTERFRVRHAGTGYAAIASPIVAEDARVGVVILFTQTPIGDERLYALKRELHEPLDEIARSLDIMLEQTGGRRGDRYRALVEDGMRALHRIQKWSEALETLLAGEASSPDVDVRCDPGRILRSVAARLQESCAASGIELELLLPSQLPAARGDARRLESALLRLVSARVASGEPGRRLTLGGRVQEPLRGVLLSVVETPTPDALRSRRSEARELAEARAVVESAGGQLCSIEAAAFGSVLGIRLSLTAP